MQQRVPKPQGKGEERARVRPWRESSATLRIQKSIPSSHIGGEGKKRTGTVKRFEMQSGEETGVTIDRLREGKIKDSETHLQDEPIPGGGEEGPLPQRKASGGPSAGIPYPWA